MTDTEIIKALECCANEEYQCQKCPFFDKCYDGMVCENALDLINRQKAEIERLKAKILEEDKLLNVRISEAVNTVSKADQRYIDAIESRLNDTSAQLKVTKIETIKEFAELLKERYPNKYLVWNGGRNGVRFVDFVDSIVEEMVGDNNAE